MSVFSTNNSRHAAPETHLHPLPATIRKILFPLPAKTFSAFILLAGLNTGSAIANTIQVNAKCSLVNAITAANTDTPVGGCSAGGGADIVVLPINSIHTLTAVNNNADLENGLPIIASKITIAGNGSTIKRPINVPKFRIFAVNGIGNLTLADTKITGGDIDNSRLPRDSNGGALLIRAGGRVTLQHSTLTGNKAAFNGGGIYNDEGTLTINNSTVSGNSAVHGGGIFNNGQLIINTSTISGNSTDFEGGGIINGGQFTVNNSTVSGNSAGDSGGGIANRGELTVNNSTISGNSAFHSGGIYNNRQLTINNSTISGNSTSAYGFGGGILNRFALILSRSLISGNTAAHGPELYHKGGYPGAFIAVNDHNLFGHNGDAGVEGFTPGATDIVPQKSLNAILKPLAANGGPTQTHLLAIRSPAINASPNDAKCIPKLDQRGVIRPQGTACDIGAVEVSFCETATPTNGCRVNGFAGKPCRGTSGADTIIGTNGADVILGLEGNDILKGGTGNDKLCGNLGNDRLEGGNDSDQLFGSFGNDILLGGPENDSLFGEQGNDDLNGGFGVDKLNGGPGGKDKCTTDAGDPPSVGCEL